MVLPKDDWWSSSTTSTTKPATTTVDWSKYAAGYASEYAKTTTYKPPTTTVKITSYADAQQKASAALGTSLANPQIATLLAKATSGYSKYGGSTVSMYTGIGGMVVNTGDPEKIMAYRTAQATPSDITSLFRSYAQRNPTSQELVKLQGYPVDATFKYLQSIQSGGGDDGGGGRRYGSSSATPVSREFLAARARYIWRDVMGCIAPLPDTLLNKWINNHWLESDDGILLVKEEIRTTDAWWNGSQAETERILWEDDWEQMVGRALTADERTQLDSMFRQGYSRVQWQDWVKSTPAYDTGVEMNAMRQTYLTALYQAWGYGAVDDLIASDPDYIDTVLFGAIGRGATTQMVLDWARHQPQWLEGPEAATTRENLLDVFTRIMHYRPDEEWLKEAVIDGMTPDQLIQYLRGTEGYQKLYAGKPAYMSETEFWSMKLAFDAVGRWYYGQSGTKKVLTAEEVQRMRDDYGIEGDTLPPGVYLDENGDYITWDGGWTMSAAQLGAMIDAGWTPGEWETHLRYTEQAWAQLDVMNHLGEALGKTYTWEDAYKLVSWGEGSGKLKAELQKAENRRAYDTVFAILNDRVPTVADYEELERTFLSPEHYYQVTMARHNAEQQFDAVDKLMRRVYGYGADLERLVDANLGRVGSGTYEALIQAAEELDRYRMAYRLTYKRDPTPEEYASFADLGGPDELEKLITVRETIKAEAPTLQKVYNAYWVPRGGAPLMDEDMEKLVGKYEGWGAVQARLDMAEARMRQRQAAVEMSLRWGAAMTPIAYTEFGGSKLPGLKRIGG